MGPAERLPKEREFLAEESPEGGKKTLSVREGGENITAHKKLELGTHVLKRRDRNRDALTKHCWKATAGTAM